MNTPSHHTLKYGLYMALGTGVVSLLIGFAAGRQFTFEHCADVQHAQTAACQEDDHAAACGDVHDEEEHEHEHAPVPADLHELDEMQCEHRLGIVHCDECRYEAGVVKLDPETAGALIQTAVVESGPLASTLHLTGQVTFDETRTVDVIPAAGGRVLDVLKTPGDPVQKGDTLAILHAPEFGQAKADYLGLQAALELAKATFAREQDLMNRTMTSQADYLEAANQLKSAQAALAASDKRLRLFGLSDAQIQAVQDEKENGDFADLKILAPQDGTLITQALSKGQLIGSADPVFRISDLSVLWVWCDVYERHLSALQDRFAAGEPFEVLIDTNAFENVFTGTVDLIGHIMDERTRTVKMRIQVSNPDRRLKPGMFAEVAVKLPLSAEGMSVPQTAVLSDEGDTFVFQHWKDDLWVRRDVACGASVGDRVEVLSGLKPGDTIVSSGAFMLKSDILREKMGAGCAD